MNFQFNIMFGKKQDQFDNILNNISVVEKLKLDENPKNADLKKKALGLTWDELKSRGITTETIQFDDDNEFVTIFREFEATDCSISRNSTHYITKKRYDELIGMADIEDVTDEIEMLQSDIESYSKLNEFETCAVIRQEIEFLKDTFNIKGEV